MPEIATSKLAPIKKGIISGNNSNIYSSTEEADEVDLIINDMESTINSSEIVKYKIIDKIHQIEKKMQQIEKKMQQIKTSAYESFFSPATMKEIQDNIHEAIKIANKRGKTHTVYHIPYTSPVCETGYHVYHELCNAIIAYLSKKGYNAHIKRNESKCGICQHILHIYWG